jgi:hypothetical protein
LLRSSFETLASQAPQDEVRILYRLRGLGGPHPEG